jgi:YfiH family protein
LKGLKPSLQTTDKKYHLIMSYKDSLIFPDWPAPANVQAASTTRQGGVSRAPYDSFNLGLHCGDHTAQVAENRRLLRKYLALPTEPAWLKQVHSACAVAAGASVTEADAAYSFAKHEVCVVMTADCLPVLFCDRDGMRVAAAHAGWRGLAAGVLENTVSALQCPPADVLAWLGPAIGAGAFEVGQEVRDAFVEVDARAAQAFQANRPAHYWCDLYELARQRLNSVGVTAIYGGEFCTYSDQRFYSYRRDKVTGRMASLIWRVS